MSSQGTGSVGAADFIHTTFLDAWGAWARTNSAGGSARKGVMNEAATVGGLSWLFTDDEMCVIDGLIAGLGGEYTKVIKRVHLQGRTISNSAQRIYADAVREFTARLLEAEESDRIKIEFLPK